jgi:imidazolonepropionase-like amidohydrolase
LPPEAPAPLPATTLKEMNPLATIFEPTWLVDGTGSAAQVDQAVVISDGVIKEVVPAAAVQAAPDDEVVSLPGMTLLPGLINNHVHAVLPGNNTPFPLMQLVSDPGLTLQAVSNLSKAFRSGVTTVRDCGGRLGIMTEVRDAQAAGKIQGARVISCGWPLTITGGHCRYFGGEVDGVEGVRTMIRRIVSAGADYVKVMASGGGTPGSLSGYPSFTRDEFRSIVETAHGYGKAVAMHCISTDSMEWAVDAGADHMEHALFFGPDLTSHFDPRVADKMAKAGIRVTTTLCPFRDMRDINPPGPEYDRRMRQLDGQHFIFGELHSRGVQLLAGSDAGWLASPFDGFWKELDELVQCGLTPLEAVNSASGAVAKAWHRENEIGSIKAGLTADLLAVQGDVASDVRCVANVRLLYQAGQKVYQQ